ncbi:hypothetical protein [Stenomitos frigidus]|uniref:hypothetical protein n=1 Tax=Stenomitos frigidus TaxID=1886765 RepID=UPI001C627548|nr:hypothetical protein [Stenomitos frigidus]
MKKKSRKERQQEEQKLLRSQPEKSAEQTTLQAPEPQPEIVFDLGLADFTPIDFDELKGGW